MATQRLTLPVTALKCGDKPVVLFGDGVTIRGNLATDSSRKRRLLMSKRGWKGPRHFIVKADTEITVDRSVKA